MRDVAEWLEALGLAEYAEAFARNRIDSRVLPRLTGDDLKDIGVAAVGHRRKLLDAIAALRGPPGAPAEGAAGNPGRAGAGRTGAARRQLTVMFCDLVGSTALSARLDPEDMREIIRAYHNAVVGQVGRFEGHVAKFMGDGVLMYFGWPTAHEDDAERAVRAGLAVVEAVGRLRPATGDRLAVRVGIATGLVVVGDLTGEGPAREQAVVGDTPNVAARLQALAPPDSVVVCAGTMRLLGGLFDAQDLGPQRLKGLAAPVQVWRVVRERTVASRFEATHPDRLAPFIGRHHELGLVQERWSLAKAAQGQAVLLAGEAGIGKSRMAQALRDSIWEDAHIRLSCQCSAYHTNSAFHPIIQHLRRATGFADDDDVDARLDKLEALLRQSSSDIGADAPLFARLLSLPCEHRYGALEMPAQQQRDRTIEVLIDHVRALSRQRPLLFVLEDAHWIDPTTETFVGEAMHRIADAPVLMLITYRPDYAPPWPELPNLARIFLNRLSRDQSAAMARAMGGEGLGAGVVGEIVARADGVPLFIEELTKALLESGEARSEIPGSLQASLAARLDRLGDVQKVAQLAATLGRSFQYPFIEAIGEFEASELKRALAAMTEAGLLVQRGTPPHAAYTFRHALIQDAAYKSLLRGTRKRYHGRVADVLLRDFPDQTVLEPEVVARHLSLAERPGPAAEFWLRAGQRAGERSEHFEAVVNLESGLRELEALPESGSRDTLEIGLRIALGASLLTARGWSAPEVEANYARVQELCERARDIRHLLVALRGQANVFFLRGEVTRARALADRELAIALEQDDRALLLGGYRSVGMCSFFVGEFASARENLRRANELYDRSLHHAQAFVHGTDPAVIGLSVVGWANWFLGNLEEARDNARAALALAEELRHPFSLAYARSLAASLHQTARDPEAVRRHAEAAIAIAEQHNYPYWLGWATVMRGWALAAGGRADEGMGVLRRGLETYESTGARQIKPYILTLLAEMSGWAGQPQEGLAALEGAVGPGHETDVRFYEAEALRVQGELLRQGGANDGRDYFERARSLARRQGARSLELRAAVSAGRAARARGELAAARGPILEVYRTFDAGLADPDLCDARDLLQTSAAGRP